MRNLRIRKHRVSQCPDSHHNFEICQECAALTDVNGQTALFYVTQHRNEFYLHHRLVGFPSQGATSGIPWDKLNISAASAVTSSSGDSCVGLAVLNSGESIMIIIAMRNGAIISVLLECGTITVEGEFVDEDMTQSGILRVDTSPDGELISVVSPKKITLLSNYWDIIAEIPIIHTAAAAEICWREDGEFFVVATKSADDDDDDSNSNSNGNSSTTHSYVISRDSENITKVDLPDNCDISHILTWQPRVGGFISFAGLNNGCVSFFERNGLRHLRSDFTIENCKKILHMKWSCDSEKFAIVHQRVTDEDDVFVVNFYVRKNYKWYCKKSVSFQHLPKAVLWDEDDPNIVHILRADCILISMQFQLTSSHHIIGAKNYSIAVDGNELLITNLSQAVIPPPMCHGALKLVAPVDEVCSLPGKPSFAALLGDGRLCTFSLTRKNSSDGFKSPVVCKPTRIGTDVIGMKYWKLENPNDCHFYRSPVLLEDGRLLVIRSNSSNGKDDESFDTLCLYNLPMSNDQGNNDEASLVSSTPVRGSAVSICSHGSTNVLVVSDEGFLQWINLPSQDGAPLSAVSKHIEHASFDQAFKTQPFSVNGRNLSHAFVLSRSGHLVLVDMESSLCLIVSKECSSFDILGKFLIFTTRSHVLYCISLEQPAKITHGNESMDSKSLFTFLPNSSQSNANSNSIQLPDSFGAIRPIDRGSIIVGSLLKDVRLILQAPRGNLETIAPRPVVFKQVREFVKSEEYGKAFILSRKQRIDMNEIVDTDFDAFIKNIDKFVNQVDKPDHLSVFLTHLKGDTEKINTIYDAIINALTSKDKAGFILPLLTAYVGKTPREYENALRTVWKNHAVNPTKSSGLIDYLFVLCKDDNVLYEVALGTYNLSLAILVAKCSKQMDPAEYGNEVKKLHAMNENERRFTIDCKLGRNDSALKYLYLFEEESSRNEMNGLTGSTEVTTERKFEKSIKFALAHALFPTAIALFKEDEDVLKILRDAFGNYLMNDKEEYGKAATIFVQNKDFRNAARAYDLAGSWQLAVGAISRSDSYGDDESRKEFYQCMKQRLQERGRAKEAAYVCKVHLKDMDDAVDLLLAGECWESAIEIIVNEDKEYEGRVVDAIKEGGIGLAKELEECSCSLREKGNRLVVVREMKRLMQERLDTGRQVAGANSDIISASTASSFASNVSDLTFVGRKAATSVYSTTAGATSVAGEEVRDRRKEKAEKRRLFKSKKKRIKQGHPHEEQYLVQYLRKRMPNENSLVRVVSMLNALAFFNFQELNTKLEQSMDQLAVESVKISKLVFEEKEEEKELIELMNKRNWSSQDATGDKKMAL